jgi:hypothetical protein
MKTSIIDYTAIHHRECMKYGIPSLTGYELTQCYQNSLSSDQCYQLACDINSEAFESFAKALEWYVMQNQAYNIGSNVAESIIDNISGPDIVDALGDEWTGNITQVLAECLGNYKSYSPFEFTVKQFNESFDPDACWDKFEQGFYNTVEKKKNYLKELATDTVTDLIQQELDDMEENNQESYDEMLIDCNGMVSIGGMEFCPARILKELDPIAYREGYLDYINALATDNDEIERLEGIKEKIQDS